jgi:hypothetical protein
MKRVILKNGLPLISKRPLGHPDYHRRGKSMVYLYVFACQDLHKIGISRDPMARLEELRRNIPFDVSAVSHLRMTKNFALLFEQSVHDELSHFRVRGEWFRATVEQINDACVAVRMRVREIRGDSAHRTAQSRRFTKRKTDEINQKTNACA